ncbi:MAG: type II toxin-antitoxin system RelE/ParE family toxin, partial [Caulobacterales bacterium]
MSSRFSPAAERDLEEIADYIAQDNPRRALSFIAELRQTAADL